ncbi:MAG TPA: nucleotidyl transferase AbiEii/AbiGii toxin family protein [Spirochaetota bacterium]|nr:nucleotidyl transferase AbiEii/AbiGii toxin family protein [Spirochaetota bacterium]HRU66645.1 nucleotidyl transferase AbiEii/AbiGii toxin family protein [Spirochaetota bacterium]
MDYLDYNNLYRLQDEVMEVVFSVENIFYLTGGTCLSRFYVEKRLSDDLDFFTNASPRYAFALRNIKANLLERFEVKVEVESRDFARFRINKILQVDFVNDIPFRYKDIIITPKGYLIDNVENILANKISAIIGRDNPKDVFDLYLVWKYYQFNWSDIIKAAREKSLFNNDDLIIRLTSFPHELLGTLRLTDRDFLKNFDEDYKKIIVEILNSLS